MLRHQVVTHAALTPAQDLLTLQGYDVECLKVSRMGLTYSEINLLAGELSAHQVSVIFLQ